MAAKDVRFGRYWRSRPFVFSLVPRCQGAIGSQKYTLQLSAEDSTRCPANSLPWSTVNDLRRFAGMFLNAAIAASVNALCVL